MPEPVLTVGLMMAGYAATVALSRPGSAVSREADAVRRNASSVVAQVQRSMALFGPKAAAISELFTLAEECRAPNWDGYGAESVDPDALELAKEIIDSLPEDLPLPESSIEPDGCVSLDWIPTRNRTFTISAGKSDRLPYAWLDGTDRGHAVARFVDGQLPPRILEEIKRICGHDPSVRAA
jgi:hypothetical protein